MRAAFKILVDVLAYRLRKLEMANMVAAIAIMLALRLPARELAVRTGYALLLNLLAYLTNDYYDVEHDLAGGREPDKTRFLAAHRREALGAQLGLAALLLAIGVLTYPGLILAAVAGAGICWAYSARLKHRAYADVIAMTLWGVAMPLVAVPLESRLGWALVLQLGLFSACFELIQVMRDHDEDRARGIETTAVRLGQTRTLTLARVMMLLSAAYAILVLQRWFGLLLLAAPLVPVGRDVSRYWNRIRMTLGVVWLATLVWVFFTSASAGWLFRVARG
jgi:4-hydroxybenzoate polyprenyltransferase